MNKQIAYNSLKRIFEHLVKHDAAEVNICLHGGGTTSLWKRMDCVVF